MYCRIILRRSFGESLSCLFNALCECYCHKFIIMGDDIAHELRVHIYTVYIPLGSIRDDIVTYIQTCILSQNSTSMCVSTHDTDQKNRNKCRVATQEDWKPCSQTVNGGHWQHLMFSCDLWFKTSIAADSYENGTDACSMCFFGRGEAISRLSLWPRHSLVLLHSLWCCRVCNKG